MTALIKTGRYLLAIAITAFGIEQFLFLHPLAAFIPMTGIVQKQLPVALITGILFIVAGARVFFNFGGKYTAWFPPAVFFLLFLLLHLLPLLKELHNGSEWTVCFELIALGSGSIIAVASAFAEQNYKWLNTARILFAAALLVFSGLHFVYAGYIATLIPAWIPFPLFWAYFFGVAFLATALSLLFKIVMHTSTLLLAAMFFIWVIVLHLPRCLHTPHAEPEWTSLFVAIAMGSIALMLAGLYSKLKKL